MEAASSSGAGLPFSPADFFADEVERLYAVPVSDVRLALGRAWQGFGVVAAGAELLALYGYPWHGPLLRDMGPALSAASPVLRSAASFPLDVEQVAVAAEEAPARDADPALAYVLHRGVYEVTLALASLLRRTARNAPQAADRKACLRALPLARVLAAAYEIRPRGHAPGASPHPAYLSARDEAELRQVVTDQADAVRMADPSDTRAVLTACWYATCAAACLAQFAASRDFRYRARTGPRASACLADVASALESAPSLPADLHGLGLDTVPPDETPPELVPVAADAVPLLAAAVAASLERLAPLARDPKDRPAAERAGQAARRLASLGTGRLAR